MKVFEKIKDLASVEQEFWTIVSKAKAARLKDAWTSKAGEDYVRLMRIVCSKSVKYNMIELACISASYLQEYFSIKRDARLEKKYTKIALKYYELAMIEKKILIDKEPLRSKLNQNLVPRASLLKRLKAFVDEYEIYIDCDSPTIINHALIPIIRYYEAINDIPKMRQLCEIGISKLEPYNKHHNYKYIFSQILLIEGDIKRAVEVSTESLTYMPNGSAKHCFYAVSAIKAHLYNKDYISANEIHQQTNWIETPEGLVREYDYLIRGYLDIFTNTNIRLGRFLNEINLYSKDKQGVNINRYIIYFFFYLQRDKNKLYDFADALDSFRRKWARGRDRHFLKVLCGAIYYDFKVDVIKLRLKDEIKQINKYRVNPDVEFAPYGDLLEQMYLICEGM